jgi:hypothetical protein
VAFTDESLLAYMESTLGPLTAQLGLDTSDALSVEVEEIARLQGYAIEDGDDDVKTAALGRWRAWLAAATAAAASFDTKAGTVDIKLSQRFKQIQMMLVSAERAVQQYPEAAAVIDGGAVATVTSISPAGSPYW